MPGAQSPHPKPGSSHFPHLVLGSTVYSSRSPLNDQTTRARKSTFAAPSLPICFLTDQWSKPPVLGTYPLLSSLPAPSPPRPLILFKLPEEPPKVQAYLQLASPVVQNHADSLSYRARSPLQQTSTSFIPSASLPSFAQPYLARSFAHRSLALRLLNMVLPLLTVYKKYPFPSVPLSHALAL